MTMSNFVCQKNECRKNDCRKILCRKNDPASEEGAEPKKVSVP